MTCIDQVSIQVMLYITNYLFFSQSYHVAYLDQFYILNFVWKELCKGYSKNIGVCYTEKITVNGCRIFNYPFKMIECKLY